MKPLNFLTIAITATLPLAEACKCKNPSGSPDSYVTKECCRILKGQFTNGDNCDAHSISNKLKDFKYCCGVVANDAAWKSDCKCPNC
ncbi:hypothetical protein PT974_07477 [Cladobotryum mycophilum]|uniref:Uncharacterized protein n=1 Tax=Cladobotryum mycophilum TaxID=491253 RepID=A0ABR0SQ59_9HYPO